MHRKLSLPSPALVISCLALLLSLGPAVKAANTVFSTDIVDGEVKTPDLGLHAVTLSKVAANAVNSNKIVDNSITTADIAGADASGTVSLGGVLNGRCSQVTVNVGGAELGQVAVIATKAALQDGILLYAQRVKAASQVEVDVCNFSGTSMTPITNLPVRVITFG